MSEVKEESNPIPEPVNTINVPLSQEYSDEIAEEHMRRMKKLAPQENYTIDIDGKDVVFNRRKIRSAERVQLESIRQELADSLTDNKKSYPTLEDKLYKKMSAYYLIDAKTGKGMTPEQFDLTEFEEIKQILNACAFRTERPIPPPAPLEK